MLRTHAGRAGYDCIDRYCNTMAARMSVTEIFLKGVVGEIEETRGGLTLFRPHNDKGGLIASGNAKLRLPLRTGRAQTGG